MIIETNDAAESKEEGAKWGCAGILVSIVMCKVCVCMCNMQVANPRGVGEGRLAKDQ